MSILNEERTLASALASYFNTEVTFSPAITFDAINNATRSAFVFLMPPGKLDAFALKIGFGPVGLEAGRDRIFDTKCFLTAKFKDNENAYIFQQGIIDLITRMGGWRPNDQSLPIQPTEISTVFLRDIGIIESIEEYDENNKLADEFFSVNMELELKIIGTRPTIPGV